MKKFYSVAAAVMLALSVNAQNGAPLYATGDGGFPGGTWSPENASEFTYADGKYTLEITNLSQLKISTVKGGWNDFNTGALSCNYGDTPGKAVALSKGDANIMAPWLGDYTIIVAGDLSTITLSTNTPKPGAEAQKIYLRGEMNGWGTDDAWALTPVKDNVYKYVFADGKSIAASQKFKVADSTWGKINYGGNGTAVQPQSDCQVFLNGSDMILSEACTGVMWFTLDFGGAAYIWYSNDKEAMPEWAKDNVTPTVSWGVIGEFNGWDGDEEMTETSAGVFTVTMASISGAFKFRQNGAWGVNFGADGNANINLNGNYAVKQDGADFTIPETKNVTFTLNTNTKVLTVYADSLTAVDEIEEDNAPAKYFNLQGVEVANPVNGLYIKVQGKKATKVLVK